MIIGSAKLGPMGLRTQADPYTTAIAPANTERVLDMDSQADDAALETPWL